MQAPFARVSEMRFIVSADFVTRLSFVRDMDHAEGVRDYSSSGIPRVGRATARGQSSRTFGSVATV